MVRVQRGTTRKNTESGEGSEGKNGRKIGEPKAWKREAHRTGLSMGLGKDKLERHSRTQRQKAREVNRAKKEKAR
ncbi:hypothetical protein COB52_05435 [Candidatus Kaiserbacteria bacterium]|nr:hypothetical protein [Flavobacteriales bacterium]PCI27055.1 MAG: hypothetical protein COB52_05435 [Candidatus Kaiserbacteria bacterium]